jgi:integrase/recombinase XerD
MRIRANKHTGGTSKRPALAALYAIPLAKEVQKLPAILSREEVTRLLSAAANLKHRVLLMTIYAAGLRVGKAVRLRVSDIDSQRKLIRVEQGKGKKDRYTAVCALTRRALRNTTCPTGPI